jgi:hypothetical protein
LTRFLGNRIPQTLLLIWLSYWPIAFLVPRGVVFEALNGMLASTSAGLAIVFFSSAWRQLRKRPYYYSSAHLLTLGIAIFHTAIVGLFGWGWLYQYLGQPAYMQQHLLRGWIIALLWLGTMIQYIVTVQTVEDADHHEKIAAIAWIRLAGVVTIGLFITVLVLLFIH